MKLCICITTAIASAAAGISIFGGSAEAANSSIPTYEHAEDGWRYEDDMIFVGEDTNFTGISSSRRLQGDGLATPEQYFDLISNFEALRDKRTGSSMWEQLDGKPTLTRMHYLVIPAWWADQPQDTGVVDMEVAQRNLDDVSRQYAAMSWNKHALTFDLWDQVVLPGITIADPTRAFTVVRELIADRGLVEFDDYTGYMLMFNPTRQGSNIFTRGGGSGLLNNNFLSVSNPGPVSVVRHEIGHNYGLPHNNRNTYNLRTSASAPFDGFEMMSGGNHYRQSDHQAATKWSFGWIPDSAVVLMQPEGSSSVCRSCTSSVRRLVLKPFDDPSVTPSGSNQMAVNIPTFGTASEASSYWLSYRGISADGDAAGGLTIHQGTFRVGGIFASHYSSLNFDVGGSTEDDKFDAFVTPGNCYVMTPPKRLLDVDFLAAQRIKPIVCVDDLDPGKSITISVSFLDEDSPPSPTVSLASAQRELQCTQSGSDTGLYEVDVSRGKAHLLHHIGTGNQGEITTDFCMSSGATSSATAYFYDSYPYAFMALDSPPGYGAFRSIDVATACQSFSSLDYESLTGEAYILIVGDSNAAFNAEVRVRSRCTLSECLPGDLLSGETCSSCPATPNVFTARAWRIVKSPGQISSSIWDIRHLSFFSDSDCSDSSRLDVSNANLIDSRNAGAGFSPRNAFDDSDNTLWGGRPSDGVFFLGAEFSSDSTVRCIRINESGGAGGFSVESRQSLFQGCWDNVVTADGAGGTREITLGSNGDGECTDENEYFNPNTNSCTECPALVDGFSLRTASTWRLSAPRTSLSNMNIWDVTDFAFYSTHDCSLGSEINRSRGTAFSSGTGGAGLGAHHAFDGNSGTIWGGRSNDQGVFNLGIDFMTETDVRCIRVDQRGKNTVSIQNRQDPVIDCWENAARTSVTTLRSGTNTIPLTICQRPTDVFRAREWRVFASRPWIQQGDKWDITEIAFYSSDNCAESSRLDTSRGTAVGSGTAGAGFGAHHAFDRNSRTIWGGRRDGRDNFFVGIDFLSPVTVKCVKVTQRGAINFNIQARQSPTPGNCFENVLTVTDANGGESTIRLDSRRRLVAPTNATSAIDDEESRKNLRKSM